MRSSDRDLDWQGCFNTRDLGGLRAGRGTIRRLSLVRSDSLASLSGTGWRELEDAGIRTVIDLRNEDEIGPDASPRPWSVETVHLPLDVIEDRGFWDRWEGRPEAATPLYFGPHLEHFPERHAAVVTEIASALVRGGVAFHCIHGRDRSGLIALVVLHLLGASPTTIAADYARSTIRLAALYEAVGEVDEGPALEEFLGTRGTSSKELIVDLLSRLDLEALLIKGGLDPRCVPRLREALTEAPSGSSQGHNMHPPRLAE